MKKIEGGYLFTEGEVRSLIESLKKFQSGEVWELQDGESVHVIPCSDLRSGFVDLLLNLFPEQGMPDPEADLEDILMHAARVLG